MKKRVTKKFAVCFNAYPVQYYWDDINVTYTKGSKKSLIANVYKVIKSLYPQWNGHELLEIADKEDGGESTYYFADGNDRSWERSDF